MVRLTFHSVSKFNFPLFTRLLFSRRGTVQCRHTLGQMQGGTVTSFFCDYKFCKLRQKILLFSKSKSGEMLLTGGRSDLSGQLLLVAHFNSSNFAHVKILQNEKGAEIRSFGC